MPANQPVWLYRVNGNARQDGGCVLKGSDKQQNGPYRPRCGAEPARMACDQRGRTRLVILIVAAFSAVSLGGCAYNFTASQATPVAKHPKHFVGRSFANRVARARIDRTLLAPQAPPDCELKSAPSDVPAAEAARSKLDYEQQCYRQSEAIARSRLQLLQRAVDKMTERPDRQ
jgi:hypothetical protein